MSTRIWATPAQTLAVAKWLLAKGVTQSKETLVATNYVLRQGEAMFHCDYKLVDAMIYALQSQDTKPKPKPKRTAKAKAS